MGFLIPAGIVGLALGLAVFFYRRKREAETQARNSNNALSDFMAAQMAMKASQLESYKAMLRQPNPRPSNPRFEWEETSGPRRRF